MGENFEALILNLIAKFPVMGTILIFLGAIVVVVKAIIDMTPNKEDDEWFQFIDQNPISGRILKFVARFAPLQPKATK